MNMSWSNEQTHQIIEQFWRDGTASCPEDNGPLKLRLHKLYGGDYDLLAECLYCGKSKGLRRADDPRRSQFRRWTPREMEHLGQLARENEHADCPVCGANVERLEALTTEPGRVVVRCLRCGNSNQWGQIHLLTAANLLRTPGATRARKSCRVTRVQNRRSKSETVS